MKASYEQRAQSFLPRRTWTLIRIDGRAFHTYTHGCTRPYDRELMKDMDATAAALCNEIDGARLAYVPHLFTQERDWLVAKIPVAP